jgi:hypothetical protein
MKPWTTHRLRERLAYWQKRNGFADWTVTIRWAKKGELIDKKTGDESEAQIWPVWDRRVAEIAIRRLSDKVGDAIVPRCIDNDICHELEHLDFDAPGRNKDALAKERTICRIAKALTETA